MARALVVVVIASLWCTMALAEEVGPPVDLISGLEEGSIWAQFWGGGDTGVNGVIGRGEGGPGSVSIRPGTQFWAQTSGRQGQTSLGSNRVSLTGQNFAQVWIPTACTNINLRAPTEEDVMIASACPSEDMERLSRSLIFASTPRPMVQVAVWAVANDPDLRHNALRDYVRREARDSQGKYTFDDIFLGAARLVERSGLDPLNYRMFR